MAALVYPKLEMYRVLVGPDHKDGPSVGPDVQAWKRMLERWDPQMFPGELQSLDDFFNRRAVHATMVAQRAWNLKPTGTVNKATFTRGLRALRHRGAWMPKESAWDQVAVALHKKAKPRAPVARCYLFPEGVATYSLGGVSDHMRRPLGNWQSDNAIDEHAAPGSIVVSIKPGYVSKVGGYDPHRGPVGTIFGEHTTVECDDDSAYFVTHLDRIVSLGERVLAGEVIGKIGDWPRSSAMDHAHVGGRDFNPESIRSWPRVKIATSD